jgi:hypothetical protein
VLYDYAARNWGYHARAASTASEQLILSLLESEAKLSACTQAMNASKQYSLHYSQNIAWHMTGVHVAGVFGLKEKMAFLFKNRHDPDSKDSYGRTPLSRAAENGHGAVVKLLREKGAKLESKDNDNGRTPLLWAAENGHEAVAKLLLEKGAELESSDDEDDWTPLS